MVVVLDNTRRSGAKIAPFCTLCGYPSTQADLLAYISLVGTNMTRFSNTESPIISIVRHVHSGT